MQLQYCEACSLRIDSDNAVTIGDKVFCPECAGKQTTPASARPGSGSRHAARASTGVQRPATPIAPRRTPAPGTAPTGPQRKVSPGAGAHSATATGSQRRTGPRTGSVPPVTTPAQPSHQSGRRADAMNTHAQASGKMLTWWIAGVGLVLAFLGVFLIMRGGTSKAKASDDANQNAGEQDGAKQKIEERKLETGTSGQQQPPPEPARKDGPGILAVGGMEDVREGSARRELDKILDSERNGKLKPLDLRKRLETFLASSTYQNTKAGREAEDRLTALPAPPSRPADGAPATAPGLQAALYEKGSEDPKLADLSLANYTALFTKKVPNLDYPDEGRITALANGRRENFIARFTGYIEAPREGGYTFYLASDDGSVLFIGDTMLVNNDGQHGMQEHTGDIRLAAGKHAFRVDYWQGSHKSGLILSWSGPGVTRQPVPASAFSSAP